MLCLARCICLHLTRCLEGCKTEQEMGKSYLNVQQLNSTCQVVYAELASLVSIKQSKAVTKVLLLLLTQEACKGGLYSERLAAEHWCVQPWLPTDTWWRNVAMTLQP